MRNARLLIGLAVLLVLLGLAVAVLGSGGTGSPTPAAAPTPPALGAAPGRKPLVFDLGALTTDTAERGAALDAVKALGANVIRVVIPWASVAPSRLPSDFKPSDPADPHYDFGGYDSLLRAIHDRGMRILLAPSSPIPRWASASGSDVADPEPPRFGDFVRALARRYGGGFDPGGSSGPKGPLPAVDIWSVWNEPNLSLFLRPQYRNGKPYSPGLYRRLFEAARAAIRAGGSNAPILIGETAPTGSTDSVDPVPFARAVLCVKASGQRAGGCGGRAIEAAGWATHPYANSATPPYELVGNPRFVTMSSLSNLEAVLQDASTAGTTAADLPVFITEYGVQSVPDPNIGVNLGQQADYLAIAERLAYADPRVASFAQYLLRDDSPFQIPGQLYGGFESGLLLYDGSRKPAYDAFRTPLSVQRIGDRASLWALVQPARGATDLQIRYQDAGSAPKSLGRYRTDAAGIVSFDTAYEPGRRWQVLWTDPASGKTFHGPWTAAYPFGLPTDTAGRVDAGRRLG